MWQNPPMNAGKWAYPTAAVIVIVIGVFLRFNQLSLKPMHHDEGVNHLFVNTLVENGLYQYNPENYHGPLLYELAYFPSRLLGFSEVTLRAVPAFLGSLVIVLILALRRWIGRPGAIAAAAIVAMSPADVFFSRTFIHEIYLVFTLALFSWFLLRFLSDRRTRNCVGAACALSLAFATKETTALTVITLVAAYGVAVLLGRRDQSPDFAFWKTTTRWPVVLLDASMAAAILWMMLYSTFTTNPKGILDFFRAFMPWLNTGVGQTGHEKDFTYFMALLWKYYQPAVLLALPALIETVRLRKPVSIFFVAWSLLHLAVYSIIPYKTPWCVVTIAFPLIVVAGLGAGAVFDWLKGRVAFSALAALIMAASLIPHASYCLELNFKRYDDDRNKIVYVQTMRKFKDMFPKIAAAAARDQGAETEIILIDSKHPTNFYLRDYTNTLYHAAPPKEAIRAPVVIASEAYADAVRILLDATYVEQRYPVWPGQVVVLFLREDVWKGSIEEN